MTVPTMAALMAEGKKPEILFWVGCAGSFDDRAQRVTKAFTKILLEAGVDFGILGNCLLYTSPSPRDRQKSRMPSSA